MTRIALLAIAHWLIGLGLLFYAYPWSVSYGSFRFPASVTFVAYLLAASLLTLVTYWVFVLTEALFSRWLDLPPRLALAFSASMLALASVCLQCGPGGWNLPGTRLQGIFFSEWNFITFFIAAGTPACLLTTIAEYFRQRRRTPLDAAPPTGAQ